MPRAKGGWLRIVAAAIFIAIGWSVIDEAEAQTPPLDDYYPTFCKQNSATPELAWHCKPAPTPTAPWIAHFGLPVAGQGSTPEAARDNAIAASNAYVASLGPISSYYDRYRVHPDFPNCSVAKTDNVFWYSPDTTRIRYYTRCETQRIDIRYDPPVVMFSEYVNGIQDTQCPVNWRPHGTVFDSDANLSHKSFPAICYRDGTVPKEMGDCPTCTTAGNPISVAIGNKYQRETDYTGAGANPLQLSRYYNSAGAFSAINVGKNWRLTYDRRVDFDGRTSAWVTRGDGKIHSYRLAGTTWVTDGDIASRLSATSTGWQLIDERNDVVEAFDSSGKLVSITTRSGEVTQLTYSDASTSTSVAPAPGYLINVTDSFGRNLQLIYGTSGRLESVTLPDSNTVQYSYDTIGNLDGVDYPDGKSRAYLYNETGYSSTPPSTAALTGIIDENNSRFATFQYDANGRAVSTEHAGGVDKFTVGASNPFQVTDPLGTVRTSTMNVVQGVNRPVSSTQPCGTSGCSGTITSQKSYDANGNATSRTDFNGNKVCYGYDTSRNLETARVEGLAGSADCATQLAASSHTAPARKITTTWHSTYRLPLTITEPTVAGNKVTTFSYDSAGNVLTKSIAVGGNTRTWTWSGYDAYGRPGTVDGPRSDVTDSTTYEYYPNTSGQNSVIANSRGMLKKVTNALGHATEITAYNPHGQPLSMTDANGLVTSMTYDARQRLKTRNIGGETTSYDYDNVGQLTKVTLPDSSYLEYTYDGAHRLTEIKDGLNNKISYTLDNMGNRIAESYKDPTGAIARTRTREYDALNRLKKDIGGATPSTQITQYGYDNNGNQTSTTDPLSRVTSQTYDALNRLLNVIDPVNGSGAPTKYEYDAQDNLTKVTDPKNLDTVYNYNGFNELTSQTSPDTGTTSFTYDAAGNMLTKTDARSVTATYTYDALNRVATIAYPAVGSDPAETVTYTYDGTPMSCPNGKGRLCSLTDKTGTTTWSYDLKGRVTAKSQTVGGVTQTLGYHYNSAGQMDELTLPSGKKVAYSYTNNRITGLTWDGQPVVKNADYEPFGPVGEWAWGNDSTGTPNKHTRYFDLDGRNTKIESGPTSGSGTIEPTIIVYDAASRITDLQRLTANTVDPAKSTTYGYDNLDRLTTVTPNSGNPNPSRSFSYDAIGNRLTSTVAGSTTNYGYGTSSHRLNSLSGATSKTYTHDAAGNRTSDGTQTWSYGGNNRPISVTVGGITSTFQINALGQRVTKSVTNGGTTTVTRFVYDEAGRLIGEYDSSGGAKQETLWFNDLPVAVIK
ncbi:MAG: RHS repeat protein [Betaproteobacteria bacterium]|nr:RHS repeat protein [Betaproteobacteria bacterium]